MRLLPDLHPQVDLYYVNKRLTHYRQFRPREWSGEFQTQVLLGEFCHLVANLPNWNGVGTASRPPPTDKISAQEKEFLVTIEDWRARGVRD